MQISGDSAPRWASPLSSAAQSPQFCAHLSPALWWDAAFHALSLSPKPRSQVLRMPSYTAVYSVTLLFLVLVTLAGGWVFAWRAIISRNPIVREVLGLDEAAVAAAITTTTRPGLAQPKRE